MNRRALIAVLALVALLVAGAAIYRNGLVSEASEPGPSTAELSFTVPQGASLRQVLHALQEQGLIRNARRLELYLRCCQQPPQLDARQIKAGQYRITPGQSPLTILTQLIEGRVELNHLTIVEGWRLAQMRELIEAHPGLAQTLKGTSDEELMRALGEPDVPAEGRFAPDTYSFAPGTEDRAIYLLALQAQERNLAEAWERRARSLPLESPAQALVLASIVEKETGLASERARIAGVFVNRLRKGMMLQSDPTVIYGLGARYDGNIRRRDLSTDTPYNTYTRKGLPPTPISLPGRDAIVATLNPEGSSDLFFVAIGDGSGGHYFSATLAEHNAAVQRYLERLRRAEPESPVQDSP